MRWPGKLLQWWANGPAWMRWGMVAAEVYVLWYASSRPAGSGSRPLYMSLLHNSAHVVVHAVLAGLVLIALRANRRLRARDAGWAVLLATAHGVMDELHQSQVPGRVCSVADVFSDMTGALLGVGLVMGLIVEPPRLRPWLLVVVLAALLSVTVATLTPW